MDSSQIPQWNAFNQFSSVESLSRVQLFVTPWTIACQASLSITNSQSLLILMSISVVPFSSGLQSPSIRVFSNQSVLRIRQPNYWSFSFNISLSNEHPELVSFRMDWLDLSCCLRDSQESSSTPQFKSINSSALSFLYSQLSHPYMTTGKTIALTRWTFR